MRFDWDERVLTERQALWALERYLAGYSYTFSGAPMGEVGTLLGEWELGSDGVFADPAVEMDWDQAVADTMRSSSVESPDHATVTIGQTLRASRIVLAASGGGELLSAAYARVAQAVRATDGDVPPWWTRALQAAGE